MSPKDIVLAILNEHFEPCGSTHGSFQGWAHVENGQGISISPTLASLIRQLSDNTYPKEKLLTTSRNDWTKEIERKIFKKLFKCKSEFERNDLSIKIWNEILSETKEKASDYHITHVFGCSLLYNISLDSVFIGPVTFSSKIFWLNQLYTTGQISKTTHRRLITKWQGVHTRPRKPGQDAASESAISHAVGDADFVCAVQTEGLIGETATAKSVMAARLGLAAISLAWQKPSKALRNMNLNFDGAEYFRNTTFSQAGRSEFFPIILRSGISGQPLRDQSWNDIVMRYQAVFTLSGEVFEYLLSPSGDVKRPKLMDALGHALIWFNAACREDNPMIAVTKFMACIDSLTQGTGGASGLIRLVTARLNVEADRPIHGNGPSFKEALTKLYADGRSRLLHGNSPRLNHDWSNEHSLAESFARTALVLCLHWAAENPDCDDPKAMAKPKA